MILCSNCGKKISSNSIFCTKCGRKIGSYNPKFDKKLIINVLAVIFIGLIIIGSITLFVLFINQKNSISDEEIQLTLSEEEIIGMEDSNPTKINYEVEKRREGYSLDDKPFDEGNYDYDERTKDFRLVCSNPCPVSKTILDQEFAAISYAVSTLRGLTQSDIDASLLPFEVHASKDDVCPKLDGALAYMSAWYVDSNGFKRGKLCFFFDEFPYNRDKFPYSTSIHEVMHLFEYKKVPRDSNKKGQSVLWEGLSEMMESFFLKGNERDSFCWKGNNWYKQEQYTNPHDAHGTGRDLFFELCNQYGFDYDDIPELFKQLEIRKGELDEKEFVEIINNIVNADTSGLFRKAEVI